MFINKLLKWAILASIVFSLCIPVCTCIEWYENVEMKAHSHEDVRNANYPYNRDTAAAFEAGFKCGIRQERQKHNEPITED